MKKLTYKELKAKRKKMRLRMARLSWHILELKFLYYEGAKYNLKCPPDEYYDAIEDKYKRLAKRLKIAPMASEHVGFPDTPSARLVAENLISNKGKIKRYKI